MHSLCENFDSLFVLRFLLERRNCWLMLVIGMLYTRTDIGERIHAVCALSHHATVQDIPMRRLRSDAI